MIKGVTIILFFYLLGEVVSLLIHHFIPGNVCGMILLFLALMLGWVDGNDVKGVAHTLTQNMALFFVPASVGLMASFELITANLITLILVSTLTTLLVMLTVGHLQQYLERKIKR